MVDDGVSVVEPGTRRGHHAASLAFPGTWDAVSGIRGAVPGTRERQRSPWVRHESTWVRQRIASVPVEVATMPLRRAIERLPCALHAHSDASVDARCARSTRKRLRGGLRCARLARRMARADRRSVSVVLGEARRALGMTQRAFGYAVGASHRSAVRWDAGQSVPAAHHLHALAKLVLPRSRDLAVEVARAADTTLVDLGLEAPPPPPGPPPPPPAPPAQHPTPAARIEDLVDVLVLVAVEKSGAAPADARRWLRAVFERGTALGLSMADAERALRPADALSPSKKRPAAGRPR
jgi:hypothetical protein